MDVIPFRHVEVSRRKFVYVCCN